MRLAVDRAALLEELREDLGFRRIKQGIGRLEDIRPVIESLEPAAGAGVLAGLVAQWVDAGFDSPALLRRILARFPAASALPCRSSTISISAWRRAVVRDVGGEFRSSRGALPPGPIL